MTLGRAILTGVLTDKNGTVVPGLSFVVCQPGTTTAITDTMYTASTGSTTVSGNSTKTLTASSTDSGAVPAGTYTCYFDMPGTHVPGLVRLYSAANGIDETVEVVPEAGNIQMGTLYDYIVLKDATQGYVAISTTNGTFVAASATDIGTVINSAITALASTGGAIAIGPGQHDVITPITTSTKKVSLHGIGAPDYTLTQASGTVLRASASFTPSTSAMVLVASDNCALIDLNLDAAGNAKYALDVTANYCTIRNVHPHRGSTAAYHSTGDHMHITHMIARNSGTTGTAFYVESGSDCVFTDIVGEQGNPAMKLAGSHNKMTGYHATGGASSLALQMDGGSVWALYNGYIDASPVDTKLLYIKGTQDSIFDGIEFKQNNTGGSATGALILVDNAADSIIITNFETQLTAGANWGFIINVDSTGGAPTNIVLGTGHANDVNALWTGARPHIAGPVRLGTGYYADHLEPKQTLTDGATVTPNAGLGNVWTLTATAGRSIAAPTNPFAGQHAKLFITNSSGGAMTTTFAATFKLAGAWTDPASTKMRAVGFYYDGSNWIEEWRSAGDITP